MNSGFKSAFRQKNPANIPDEARNIAEISGRGETPPIIFATQEDEDGIRLLPCPVPKPQPPIICKTEDMMITVIIVGKGWLKEEMSGRE